MLFVFMSQPDFGCNPYALWKYIIENTDYETAWILKRPEYYEEIKKRGIRCALFNTIDAENLVNEANYVIMNSYTFLKLKKNEKQIWVNLWHGSGIKAHDYYNHEMSSKHVKKLHDYFEKVDIMCVHSLDDRFKLAAQLHYDMRHIYVTGQPRLDNVKITSGREKLITLFGNSIESYDHFIFFAPSFRANMSSHSGTIYSDNIFRLSDYDDTKLHDFLEKYNAAIIYKLHPIEQTAFAGREFKINERCFELTDKMLFDSDIRYYDILNAFDSMISDYSSIAFDYLVLNRPIVYLIPDYDEYTSERGFVFTHVEDYMPGTKAFHFSQMIDALEDAFINPMHYEKERQFVLHQRFDYQDNKAAQRCLEKIMNYEPITDIIETYHCSDLYKMPSDTEHLRNYVDKDIVMVDSTKQYSEEEKNILKTNERLIYVTGEVIGKYRRLTGQTSDEIADLQFYYDICRDSQYKIFFCPGGVDYSMFSNNSIIEKKEKIRIGFAGNIDGRIYFAMVQCICEVFTDYEIVFAGYIHGDYPVWLDGFENLHYISATYEELPKIINSFDVAILPFFGRHQQKVPTEFYQYLAVGKQVIASDMLNLPVTEGVYTSKSITDAVENIKTALKRKDDESLIIKLRKIAYEADWSNIAKRLK